MKDYKAEKIKNMLKKIWIKEFHSYSMKLTDVSREVMDDMLKFESDCMTIQIIFNSIDIKGLSDSRGREGERKKYINNLGKQFELYSIFRLSLSRQRQRINRSRQFRKAKGSLQGLRI